MRVFTCIKLYFKRKVTRTSCLMTLFCTILKKLIKCRSLCFPGDFEVFEDKACNSVLKSNLIAWRKLKL